MVTEHPYEDRRAGHDDDHRGAGGVRPGDDVVHRGDQGARGNRDAASPRGRQDVCGTPDTQGPQDESEAASASWENHHGDHQAPQAESEATPVDEAGACAGGFVPPTDWERLGRNRPVPFALFDEATGQRLTGRAERAEWNAACDGGRPPAPEPVDPSVVPALPEEMLQALGWREVVTSRGDTGEEKIREFLGPAPTEEEAREVAECFGWNTEDYCDDGGRAPTGRNDRSHNGAGPGGQDREGQGNRNHEGQHSGYQADPGREQGRAELDHDRLRIALLTEPDFDDPDPPDLGVSAADRLAQADPDPIPRGWPRPTNPDLPVGLAPRTDGQVADVGAHARRPADWQALHDLEQLDVPATCPYTLVEAVAAWKRQEALAGYHLRMLAFELAHRRQDLAGTPAFERAAQATNPVAAVEVAWRLGVTRQRARKLIDAGTAMATGNGILVGIALQQGEIDAPKADLIIERTAHLPMDLAMNVHDAVLPEAGLRTYPQVERDLAKAIAEADPEDFSERHRHARTGRYVSAPRALPDGMAAIRLVTSAADAMALHKALEAAARAAKRQGDTRTLDQLRADALTTVAHTALATGHLGPCTSQCTHPSPTGQGQNATGASQHQVDHCQDDGTNSKNQGGQADKCPATPITGTDHGTDIDDGATASANSTNAAGADSTNAAEASAIPRARASARADSNSDADADAPSTNPGRGRASDGAGPAAGAQGAAFGLGAVGGAKAQIHITVPLSTLMGTSSAAGDLQGYGPIPAEVARAYAAGGIWRRLVTDPLTDRVIEATARRYEPPAWLRELVIANEPYCTAPGCNTAARLADLDHGIPFPHGPTTEQNLHPVCRHHHGLKTEGHVGYTSPEPGVHEWTTPTGHRYRTTTHTTHLLPPLSQEAEGVARRHGMDPDSAARAGPAQSGPAQAGPAHSGPAPASAPGTGPVRRFRQPTEDDPPPF